MTTPLWEPLDEDQQTLCAIYGQREHGGVRMLVARDDQGRLLVYSPGGGLPDHAFEELAPLGEVRWLLAPNHFHNTGLKAWHARYPDAEVIAHPRAHPRLQKRCPWLSEIGDVGQLPLPPGHRVLTPPGAKQGETWLSVQINQQRAWIVCDALLNVPSRPPGFAGLVTRVLGLGLRVNPLFWRLFMADRDGFKRWFIEQIERERPTMLVPCHGDIDARPDLSDRLLEIIAAR